LTPAISLLLSFAAALGFSNPDREVIESLAASCSDISCLADGAIYAAHESGFQVSPRKRHSWDAVMGLSSGPWQLHGAPAGVKAQAKEWVRRRALSLAQWGDLRGLPGATDRGKRIAASRSDEALLLLLSAGASRLW
jgi:hypothetical protein